MERSALRLLLLLSGVAQAAALSLPVAASDCGQLEKEVPNSNIPAPLHCDDHLAQKADVAAHKSTQDRGWV